MVRPVTAVELGIFHLLRLRENLACQRLRVFRHLDGQPHLGVLELARQHGFERGKPGKPVRERLRVVHRKTRVAQRTGVIAVGLDQVEEIADVLRIQPGSEEQIHAAVLEHVAEVAVALGKRRVLQQEVVVIALQVAVLAPEQVELRAAGHLGRKAAPQTVVEIALANVGIEARVGGHGEGAPGDPGDQVAIDFTPGLEIVRRFDFRHEAFERFARPGMTVQAVEHPSLAGLQFQIEHLECRGRLVGHDLVRQVETRAGTEAERPCKIARPPEHALGIHQHRRALPVQESREKIARDHPFHLRAVGGPHREPIESQPLVHALHAHECLGGTAHEFHGPLVEAIGQDLGQAVDDPQRSGLRRAVDDLDPPHHTRHRGLGQREGVGADAEFQARIDLLHANLVRREIHALANPCCGSALERLPDRAARAADDFHEGAKTAFRRQLPGLVGRIELEERTVLVAHAQARHRLAAIDVENPGGTPARSGDSGQKTGEGYAIVVLLDDKAVGDVIVTIGLCHVLHPGNSRDSTPRGSAVRVAVLYAKSGAARTVFRDGQHSGDLPGRLVQA